MHPQSRFLQSLKSFSRESAKALRNWRGGCDGEIRGFNRTNKRGIV